MRTDLPTNHVSEAHALEMRAYVDLVEVEMTSPAGAAVYAYLCAQKDIVWQGKTWERFEHTISGYSQKASEEVSRPKFSIINPAGVFSKYAFQGYLNNAIVSQYRVLRPDIDNNINSFQFLTWRVSKVLTLNKNLIVLELRSVLDGHNFFFPARTYRPPEFPTVSLK